MKVVLPWLDIGVKYSVLIFGTYYLFMKCVSEKRNMKKTAAAVFFSLAMGFSLIRIRLQIAPMHLTLMLVYIMITNCFLCRNELNGKNAPESRLKLSDIVVLSLLSFALSEAIFMIVGFLTSAVLSVLYYNLYTGRKSTLLDFLNDYPVHIGSYLVAIFLVWWMIYLTTGMKRLRRGLMNIVQRGNGGTGLMLALLMLTVVMAFGSTRQDNANSTVTMILMFPMLILCVIMIFWIKWEIKAEYVRRVRERNLLLMEGSLAEKDKEIAAVVSDNECLADIIRRDDQLLSILNDAVKEGSDSETISQAAGAVMRLYSERSGAVTGLESRGRTVCQTGDNTVDAVLLYMAGRAQNSGIDFDVEVKTDMGHLGAEVNRREFNTILADLTENAIISAGAVKEKHVEVMLLRNEEHLRLEVLDSGNRFDIEVLKKMGRQRITTHAEEGGSGIGLMTLFKFLRQTGASLAIEEYSGAESNAKYNKSVRVTFDGEGRLRLITDRADELKKALKSGRFEITKR